MRRINLYGGPGIGKSTVAAQLFAHLKVRGFEVELVNEWIKAWAWQGIKPGGFDQLYVFAKQLRKEDIVLRHGGFIVTDSPLFTQLAYLKQYGDDAEHLYDALTIVGNAWEKKYPSLNILLDRGNREYRQKGRYQNERQAKEIDNLVKEALDKLEIPYVVYCADQIGDISDVVIQTLTRSSHERATDLVGQIPG